MFLFPDDILLSKTFRNVIFRTPKQAPNDKETFDKADQLLKHSSNLTLQLVRHKFGILNFFLLCYDWFYVSLKCCLDSSPWRTDFCGSLPSSWPECSPRPLGFAGRFRIEGTAEVGRGHRGLDEWQQLAEINYQVHLTFFYLNLQCFFAGKFQVLSGLKSWVQGLPRWFYELLAGMLSETLGFCWAFQDQGHCGGWAWTPRTWCMATTGWSQLSSALDIFI